MSPGVYHYFEKACRRSAERLDRPQALPVVDSEGNSAVFSLQVFDGYVSQVRYKCTTCVTLVALCEHLAEILPGMKLEEAAAFDDARLLAMHPEIPPERRGRAVLAARALRSALRKELT